MRLLRHTGTRMVRVLSPFFAAVTRQCRLHPGRTILAVTLMIASVHIGGYAVRGVRQRIVRGDAVHYYVYTRSLVFDRDLDFENDYKGLYTLDFNGDPPPPDYDWWFKRTQTGLIRNYMAIGTPLVWLPGFLGVTGAVALWDAAGGSYPLDGYGLPFQLVPSVTGLLAGGLGLWLTFLLCREAGAVGNAMAATLATFAGTSYLYYMLVSPSYSHAVSACVSAGFFLFWWRSRDRTTVWRYTCLGLIGGLFALVRWQDGLAMIVVVFDILAQGRRLATLRERFVFAVTRLTAAGLASLAVFSPQIAAWQALYGQPFTVPQGSGFMKWSSPALLPVLFSPLRGLFSWTPIAAAALLAIPWSWRQSRRMTMVLTGFFLVSLYVNAAVADWWAGEAFGARRFLSCFPVMAVGLTVLLSRTGRWRVVVGWLAAALVAANLLLLFHYELFMLGYRSLAPYPDNWITLWVDRFAVPFRLLASIF
jgi:hypothetical protein